MRSEIISVGTELLLGQICNSNARDLSQELARLGIDVFFHTVVGDNRDRLRSLLSLAWQRSQLIVLTGGLGPTDDDVTREEVAEFLGRELQRHCEWEDKLRCYFARREREMTGNNLRQALVPEGASILPNPNGTAPGLWLEEKGRQLILLPGPPAEAIPMFRKSVAPRLRTSLPHPQGVIRSRVLKVWGMGESQVEERLYSLLRAQGNPTLATLAKEQEIWVRLTAKGASAKEADMRIEEWEPRVRELLGSAVFGCDEEDMENIVGNLLLKEGLTLSLAESCTGGLVSHRLSRIAGASAYLMCGLVCYSNRAKETVLGVDPRFLREFGAVSPQVAMNMARKARELGGSDLGLGITGVAGPHGGTEEKPVGLVFVALSREQGTRMERHVFPGSRHLVQSRASQAGLDLVRRHLQGESLLVREG